jgi:hypothetical protein
MMRPIPLYLLHLNPGASGMTDRYAVLYREAEGDALAPLWGDHVEQGDDGAAWNRAGRKAAKRWPYMVWQPRRPGQADRFPAFHFALQGYGYSKPQDLAESIAKAIRYPVELHHVTGWASSVTRGELPADVKPGSRAAAWARITRKAPGLAVCS